MRHTLNEPDVEVSKGNLRRLLAPSLFGPAQKAPHSVPFDPDEPEKCSRIQVGCLRTEECLHAPADVRALPGV